MKKIKPGEYKTARCHQCGGTALWRANRLSRPMYACNAHSTAIVKAEKDAAAVDNGHMSEADHQTWGRL